MASVETAYYVRSSLLGGRVVSELISAGQKVKTNVYLGEDVLAELTASWVAWRHENQPRSDADDSGRQKGD